MSVAIIAEYNPFHNGHIYQLQYAKKKFPNEKIIIIMSGKYVQRGELAIASFRERKKIALKYGADEVIELPFKYATQAAHIFASGAIKIINQNKIDKILFGSESDDVDVLILIAKTIKEKKQEYNIILKKYLKQGFSFPKANGETLKDLLKIEIKLPNDILGLEYVKAIINNNYQITPYCLKRTIGFHSNFASDTFASASLIREMIYKQEDVSQFTPMKFLSVPDRIEDHYQEFQDVVKTLSVDELKNIQLISEGMENLFKKHIDASSYDVFVERCTSRRYTHSRIKRVMLSVLLQLKKEMIIL